MRPLSQYSKLLFIAFTVMNISVFGTTQTRTVGSYSDNGGDQTFASVANMGAIGGGTDCSGALGTNKKLKGYFDGFNFAIPAGAVVSEVTVTLRGAWNGAAAMKECKVQIDGDGGIGANEFLNNVAAFPAGGALTTVTNTGNGATIFGTAVADWTADNINSSDGGNGLRLYLKHLKSNEATPTFCFDYVAITVTYENPCSPCYSVASGNWSDETTWSNASNGASGFTPASDGTSDAFIEDGDVVNLDTDASINDLTMGTGVGTGVLNWTAASKTLTIKDNGVDDGSITILSGSSMNENAQTSANIYLADPSTYTIAVADVATGLKCDNLIFGVASSTTLSGAGTISIEEDLQLNGSGITMINNLTGTFNIAQDFEFSTGVPVANTTIWSEGFETYANGETVGNDNNNDGTGNNGGTAADDWTISGGVGANEFETEQKEPTTGGQSFQYHHGGTEGIWLTENITITGLSNVTISANWLAHGNIYNLGGEYLELEYSIDAGAWTTIPGGSVADTDMPTSHSETSGTATIAGLSGTTLAIRARFFTNDNHEYLQIDEILVTASSLATNGTNTVTNNQTMTFTGADSDLYFLTGTTNTFTNGATGTTTGLDDIAFSAAAFSSGYITVNGSTTNAEDIVFVTDVIGNAHSNYITNAGDLNISDSISVVQTTTTFTNTSTGTFDFVAYYGGDRNTQVIDNTGTITQTGSFTGILPAQTTFTNIANSVWNYNGDNHDRDVRLYLTAVPNTFYYSRSGSNQEIIRPVGDDYHHLQITGSFTKTPHVDDGVWTIDIAGDLNIGGTAILDVSARGNDITIAGNWSNRATAGFTEGDETVTFDGISAQSINTVDNNAENFHNLSFTGTNALSVTTTSDALDIENDLVISGATAQLTVGTNNINIARHWTNRSSAGFNEGTGTVTFDGVVAQTINTVDNNAENFYNVSFTGANALSVTTASDALDIENDLVISGATAVLSPGANTINIAGDWTNYGTAGFVEGTGIVEFDGAGGQNITISGGGGIQEFYNLYLNKTGANLVRIGANTNVTLGNFLDFTGDQGYLDAATNNATITITDWDNLDIKGYDVNEFILMDDGALISIAGVVATDVLNLPMGSIANEDNYQLADVTMNNAGAGTFTATICDRVAADGTCSGAALVASEVASTWVFSSTSTDVGLALHWDIAAEQGAFDRTSAFISRFNSPWGALAVGQASVNVVGNLWKNTMNSTGATAVGKFAIGSGASVLPIELISFSASKKNKVVDIAWSTSSEINNDYFTVERSTDGNSFEEIAVVAGAGNSFTLQNYYSNDLEPKIGKNYYRLKQTDFDGTEVYSSIVTVEMSNDMDWSTSTGSNLDVNLYPNPLIGSSFYLSVENPEEEKQVLVTLSDQFGREAFSKVIIVEEYGNSVSAFDTQRKLKPGIYIITGSSDHNLFTKKLIVR